jgi:hypothetical protein
MTMSGFGPEVRACSSRLTDSIARIRNGVLAAEEPLEDPVAELPHALARQMTARASGANHAHLLVIGSTIRQCERRRRQRTRYYG